MWPSGNPAVPMEKPPCSRTKATSSREYSKPPSVLTKSALAGGARRLIDIADELHEVAKSGRDLWGRQVLACVIKQKIRDFAPPGGIDAEVHGVVGGGPLMPDALRSAVAIEKQLPLRRGHDL